MESIIVISTAVMALATIAIAFFAWKQHGVQKSLLDQQEQLTKLQDQIISLTKDDVALKFADLLSDVPLHITSLNRVHLIPKLNALYGKFQVLRLQGRLPLFYDPLFKILCDYAKGGNANQCITDLNNALREINQSSQNASQKDGG